MTAHRRDVVSLRQDDGLGRFSDFFNDVKKKGVCLFMLKALAFRIKKGLAYFLTSDEKPTPIYWDALDKDIPTYRYV